MKPLNIAIDASRTTVTRPTGTEHYALQLIRHIIQLNAQAAQPHQLHLYFRDVPPPDLFPQSDCVRLHSIPFPRAWTHLRFAAAIWQHQPDVTFVPAHTLPFMFPGKAVVTVHDLGYKLFPEAHPPRQRFYLDLTTRYSSRRATRIFADSRATAADLTRFYGTPADKIRIVYPGVEPLPVGDIEAVRRKYGLPERYFLFIGTLQPRKNIQRLVAAYQQWREQHPGKNIGLVLAGGKGWLFNPAWVENVPGITLPGFIDEVDKGTLYAGAVALVFPSLYEGFGFPALEAMHCGTPVIASQSSSLPELVGDAGLLVDPLDTAAIAAALAHIIDDDLRARFKQQGAEQVRRFQWDAAAQTALETLMDVGEM